MTEHKHEYKRKEYEYKVYDFHCIHCDRWATPDEIERALNACEALSAEDAKIIDALYLQHHRLPVGSKLRSYARILEDK